MGEAQSNGEPNADELVGRLMESMLGAMDLLTIYLGDRLGLYSALAEGPATASELAARAGINARYAREWLEQQGATGFLTASGSDDARRFALPDAFREVFTDPLSMLHFAPAARFVASLGAVLPALLDAYRSGDGVDWSAFGADAREGQAGFNRPLFHHVLGQDYLPSIPDIHERISQPGATIADVGCGAGWSTIAMAKAYPGARVDGYDIDEASVQLATANAAAEGLRDRVAFHCIDAALAGRDGTYDLVTAFECIHDMPNPVAVLAGMRRLAAPGGSWLVMDERVADTYEAPAGMIDRFMYGASVLCCLPAGMVTQPSAATGTVMRTSTFTGYAKEAGFTDVEVSPIEHDMFRFYRMRL